MNESPPEKQNLFARLGEDWLAVIIGLILVTLTWAGIITDVPWPLFGFIN